MAPFFGKDQTTSKINTVGGGGGNSPTFQQQQKKEIEEIKIDYFFRGHFEQSTDRLKKC